MVSIMCLHTLPNFSIVIFFQVVSNHAMLVLMFKYNYVLYSGVKDFVKSNYLTFNKAKTILELKDEVLGEYLSKSLIYIGQFIKGY